MPDDHAKKKSTEPEPASPLTPKWTESASVVHKPPAAPVEKSLDVTSGASLAQAVSDVKTFGDPNRWRLLCKASSQAQGWMKSTKVLTLENGGSLVQVTTQQRNPDGSWALAEAVCFVPNVHIATPTP